MGFRFFKLRERSQNELSKTRVSGLGKDLKGGVEAGGWGSGSKELKCRLGGGSGLRP